ncbi:hypothetical protein [Blastomonas sp.]|uniref:hypothetical protein n=1 Tax=Blastomonas sp. TaxID=1909299 RepID=UPI00261CF1A4|nr:hypothetical protein [Blastomonas sp.]MDM7957796.1 hypothetical protein [Blastomonas sp.]
MRPRHASGSGIMAEAPAFGTFRDCGGAFVVMQLAGALAARADLRVLFVED